MVVSNIYLEGFINGQSVNRPPVFDASQTSFSVDENEIGKSVCTALLSSLFPTVIERYNTYLSGFTQLRCQAVQKSFSLHIFWSL